MRPVASICLLALTGLAACTGTQQVSSTPPSTSTSYNPPSVSYQVTGNDLTSANQQAATYCSHYNASARLQTQSTGNATYQCIGGTATAPGTVMAPAGTVVMAPNNVAAPMVTTVPAGSVMYPVVGSDLGGANQSAINYCRQMGRNAQLTGVSGGNAYYNCI
jgi:hypothetical protein